MIVGIDHVQLAMPPGREDEARAFYAEIFGLAEVPKPPELAKRGGAWFESDRVKIHLGVDPDFRPATKAHPALLVTELKELVVRLRAAGHAVAEDAAFDELARVYVTDPFGNRLELMERRASSVPISGNVADASQDTRGWFLGHFMPGVANPLRSDDVELKWFTHAKGETRAEWAPASPVRTLNILIRGRFALVFPSGEVLLEKEGDFVLFGPGVPHSFRSDEESLVLTVRWPSAPQ